MLKRDPGYNILLEDLEESKNDWVYRVEGLFQEVHGQDHLILHKGRIYQEIGRAKPLKSEGPIPQIKKEKTSSEMYHLEKMVPFSYCYHTVQACTILYGLSPAC